MDNLSSGGLATLFLSTTEREPVSVNITSDTGIDETVAVSPSMGATVLLPSSIRVEDATERNKGLHIQAEEGKRVSVYGVDSVFSSISGFLALPCTPLPTEEYEFYAVSVPAAPAATASGGFLVVACEDSSQVTFTPTQQVVDPDDPSAVLTIQPGTNKTITLNEGETLYISSIEDLTGSRVVSNKPVSFFSGHECANVPANASDCDQIVEQLPPTATWGEFFLTAPIAGRTAANIFKVVASEGNTLIGSGCSNATTTSMDDYTLVGFFSLTDAGQAATFETRDDQYCWILATKPVLVVQFSSSVASRGDSFMVQVPPIHLYTNNLTFAADSAINVYVTPDFFDPERIKLDGNQIDTWVTISCGPDLPCGYAAQVPVEPGVHSVQHEDEGASLMAVGYGLISSREGYGFVGGMELALRDGMAYCVCGHFVCVYYAVNGPGE